MQFDWATLDKHPVKTPMVQRKALTSILHKKSRTSPTPKRQKTVTFASPLSKQCDGDELSEESVARMVWVKYSLEEPDRPYFEVFWSTRVKLRYSKDDVLRLAPGILTYLQQAEMRPGIRIFVDGLAQNIAYCATWAFHKCMSLPEHVIADCQTLGERASLSQVQDRVRKHMEKLGWRIGTSKKIEPTGMYVFTSEGNCYSFCDGWVTDPSDPQSVPWSARKNIGVHEIQKIYCLKKLI